MSLNLTPYGYPACAEPGLSHFVVLWQHPAKGAKGVAFEGDVYAPTPSEARQWFRDLFPADRIRGVKLAHKSGRGRFVG